MTTTKGDAMHELERLILAAKERTKTDSLYVRSDSYGWNLIKNGPREQDVYNATFEQVLARLREWAGEPDTEPEPMTVPELMAMMNTTARITGLDITVSFRGGRVFLVRDGAVVKDCEHLDAIAAKLTEWATPKLPEFATLENVPVAWVQMVLSDSPNVCISTETRAGLVNACKATMAKLQNLQHT